MYNLKSHKAEEFINHDEVLDTLKYAEENKSNIKLIDEIIRKAKLEKGLTHREASVLLACDIQEKNEEIFKLAKRIKQVLTDVYTVLTTRKILIFRARNCRRKI